MENENKEIKETLSKLPIPKVTPSRVPPNKPGFYFINPVSSRAPMHGGLKSTNEKKEPPKKDEKHEDKKEE